MSDDGFDDQVDQKPRIFTLDKYGRVILENSNVLSNAFHFRQATQDEQSADSDKSELLYMEDDDEESRAYILAGELFDHMDESEPPADQENNSEEILDHNAESPDVVVCEEVTVSGEPSTSTGVRSAAPIFRRRVASVKPTINPIAVYWMNRINLTSTKVLNTVSR